MSVEQSFWMLSSLLVFDDNLKLPRHISQNYEPGYTLSLDIFCSMLGINRLAESNGDYSGSYGVFTTQRGVLVSCGFYDSKRIIGFVRFLF